MSFLCPYDMQELTLIASLTVVSGAHRMQKRDKSSSRVVGSLLMEALEWDKDVKIPKDLPKMYLKMTQEFSMN